MRRKREREAKSDITREENLPVWWSCESSPSTGNCSAPGCNEHGFLCHRSRGQTVCRDGKQDIWLENLTNCENLPLQHLEALIKSNRLLLLTLDFYLSHIREIHLSQ